MTDVREDHLYFVFAKIKFVSCAFPATFIVNDDVVWLKNHMRVISQYADE